MFKFPKVVALLLSFCAPVAASSDLISDLNTIYQDALSNDSQLQGARKGLQAGLEGRAQVRAALFPTITLDANAMKNHSQTIGESGDSYNSTGFGITLSQGLYHRDIIISGREIEADITQGELEYQLAGEGLILRVANAYFGLLSAQDGLELARAERRAISQHLKQTRQRFDVGLFAITDVYEAQASYDMVVAQEIAAQTALDNSREALREIVGKAVGEVALLQSDLPMIAPEPADVGHWIKLALRDNLILKIEKVATEIAKHGVDKANAGHYPTLDLVGSYDYSDRQAINGDQRRDSSIGLRLNIPLYSGGFTSSRARESNFRYQQAQYRLEQQRRATERDARSAYLGVTAGINLVKAYRQALASNQTAYEATQAGFDAGTRTTLDLLNAQREEFRSKRDYASARYDYLLASLELKAVVGALTESDLKQINDYLK